MTRSPSATSAAFSKTSGSLSGFPEPPIIMGTFTACSTSSTVFAASLGDVSFKLGSVDIKWMVTISAPNSSTHNLAHSAGSLRTSL